MLTGIPKPRLRKRPRKNEPVVIGDCALWLGDCLEILPTLGKVDAVVTDPPYGVEWEYASYSDTFEEWKRLVDWFVPAASKITDGPVTVCTSKIEGEAYLYRMEPLWRVCWYKGATTVRCATGFKDWETIFIFNGRARTPFHDFMATPPQRDQQDIGHPCPKPVAWGKWLVKRLSEPNQTILDPFMGSGTTGVACVKLGRKFIGIEIEPKYFDIACKRIEKAYSEKSISMSSKTPLLDR